MQDHIILILVSVKNQHYQELLDRFNYLRAYNMEFLTSLTGTEIAITSAASFFILWCVGMKRHANKLRIEYLEEQLRSKDGE